MAACRRDLDTITRTTFSSQPLACIDRPELAGSRWLGNHYGLAPSAPVHGPPPCTRQPGHARGSGLLAPAICLSSCGSKWQGRIRRVGAQCVSYVALLVSGSGIVGGAADRQHTWSLTIHLFHAPSRVGQPAAATWSIDRSFRSFTMRLEGKIK